MPDESNEIIKRMSIIEIVDRMFSAENTTHED
jgi:hypothetical protein